MKTASRSLKRRIRSRAGFSLAELLVAVVLLGIVGGALTRLVVDQMRFFDNVQVARGARTAARNSMNVMLSELRMVQDSGGITAVAGDNKSITVNVPYRFGLFCGTNGGVSTVSMLPVDSLSLSLASFAGYGWRGRASGRYTIVATGTQPAASATPTRCTGTGAGEAGIATISVNGRTGAIFDIQPAIAATTALGSAVMFYQSVTYSFAASSLYPGKFGLYRSVNGGTPEELMAPFASTARFYYYQSGDDTYRATAPALSDIRGVAVALTAEGARRPAGRTTDAQSNMMTAIFFKNTRAP
jgi:prepilin-type N-terminal cleavage/methylation domain-containing protein